MQIRILQVVTHMERGGLESMLMNYYRYIDRKKVQFDFLVHRQERAAFDDDRIPWWENLSSASTGAVEQKLFICLELLL